MSDSIEGGLGLAGPNLHIRHCADSRGDRFRVPCVAEDVERRLQSPG
jgi:hypothetical protein